jgi:chromate transporter
VVLGYHWIDEATFLADFAIARMAPGPTSLIVTLIGWQVSGWLGAVVATLAIFTPSSLLVFLLARIWARYRGAPWQKAVERGLAPVAAGLILSTCLTLFRASGGWLAGAVALGSTALVMTDKVNPLLLVAAGAAIFLVAGQ